MEIENVQCSNKKIKQTSLPAMVNEMEKSNVYTCRSVTISNSKISKI